MGPVPRQYEMSGRHRAMEVTRAAILDAAVDLFEPAWFDEVTLADVARRAGVSQQTVINHFGSKTGLYLAGLAERFAPSIRADRAQAKPGDLTSIVETVVRDYERTGDGTWRTIVLAERVDELRPVIQGGRQAHQEWVKTMCAPLLAGLRGRKRERVLTLLVTALEVGTWKSLRRDAHLDQADTALHLRMMVEGIITSAR